MHSPRYHESSLLAERRNYWPRYYESSLLAGKEKNWDRTESSLLGEIADSSRCSFVIDVGLLFSLVRELLA
ncbi:unnamed protein product [Linum trigynum]|uniref:Uncharacterized protein n=1 Tax=Linum trigynum TaxID=586398 RepID=A0AAV2E6R4_9ROSI